MLIIYCRLHKPLTSRVVQVLTSLSFFSYKITMLTTVLLALTSIAATAAGQPWGEIVSKTSCGACAEAKKPLRQCYEIIYKELVEEIILKGDCASYQVYWPSGKMSKWYKGNKNDILNKPCNRAKCIISSAGTDGWKVKSNRRWDKIILNGQVPAFKVKMRGEWSRWYKPQ